jgi:hypothetical protein
MRKILIVIARDVLGLGGAGLVIAGMSMIYVPAGMIVAGVALVAIAASTSRGI